MRSVVMHHIKLINLGLGSFRTPLCGQKRKMERWVSKLYWHQMWM